MCEDVEVVEKAHKRGFAGRAFRGPLYGFEDGGQGLVQVCVLSWHGRGCTWLSRNIGAPVPAPVCGACTLKHHVAAQVVAGAEQKIRELAERQLFSHRQNSFLLAPTAP